ncbi:peptidase C39 family protein [Inquilinus sp. YAF38]|uniref:peptidase C39 family protein n=1 Tax=Inquilinus sp. YAF38 TaxID=3233084 RepID=UPI003F8E9B06
MPDDRPAAPTAETIRLATSDDVPRLLEIESRAFDHDRLSRRSFLHFLTRGHAVCLAAEAGGQLLGYALVLLRRTTALARLYSLAVDPAVRGRGLGARLLEAAERAAHGEGALFLRLEVRPDNVKAIALYESRGYRHFGRYLDFYEDHADALRFEKRLGTSSQSPGDQPQIDLHVPYYAQTTNFTCGAATLLMALKALDPETELSRARELRLWREATTIYMTSGHGGCDPYGMALAAHDRGLRARIFVSDDSILFLDGVRSPDKKAVMTVVQEDFRMRCARRRIEVEHRALGLPEMCGLIGEGAIPIVLISLFRGYGEKNPHWVVANGFDERFIYVHDPWVAVTEMESASTKANLPIPRREFERMARYGRTQLRAAVVLSRKAQ